MTMRQVTRGGRSALGMAVASTLLIGAWWASAETCGDLRCTPMGVVTAMAENPILAPTVAADPLSRVSQAGSLLLLGSAFAVAGHLLKRQRSS
jgi:hypothetical protein